MIKFSPQHLNLDQVGVRATAKVTFKDMTKGYSSIPPGARGIGGFAAGAVAGARLARAIEAHKTGSRVPGPHDTFAIEYTFKPSNGEALFGVQGISRDTYHTLSVGTEVPVIYHPANPSVHRLPAYTIPFNSRSVKRILTAIFGFMLGSFAFYRGIMNAMGRTSDKKADAKLERIAPRAARAGMKPATATGTSGARVEPHRPTRQSQQFGVRARA